MIEWEAKKDLIGRMVINVVADSYKQQEDLFDSVALYLDDGSVVVFRSVPELSPEVITHANQGLHRQD